MSAQECDTAVSSSLASLLPPMIRPRGAVSSSFSPTHHGRDFIALPPVKRPAQQAPQLSPLQGPALFSNPKYPPRAARWGPGGRDRHTHTQLSVVE